MFKQLNVMFPNDMHTGKAYGLFVVEIVHLFVKMVSFSYKKL